MRICGSWGPHGSDLRARALTDPVQRGRRCAGQKVQPRVTVAGRRLPRSPLSSPRPAPAAAGDPPPLLQEWTLYRGISSPPARTSHWVPTGCQFRGGGGAGRPRGGFQKEGWEGGRGQENPLSITGHAPRLPHAHYHCGAAQVGGPMCAPPVGSGYWAARRKACRQDGRGYNAHWNQ